MEIAVSYSRKLSHELYGGNSYESSDHFCSLKIEIDDETNPEETHKELAEMAEKMVNSRVEEEIMGFQGGVPHDEFKKFIYDYVAGRPINGERYYAMSRAQQDLVQTIKRGKATNKRDNGKSKPNKCVQGAENVEGGETVYEPEN